MRNLRLKEEKKTTTEIHLIILHVLVLHIPTVDIFKKKIEKKRGGWGGGGDSLIRKEILKSPPELAGSKISFLSFKMILSRKLCLIRDSKQDPPVSKSPDISWIGAIG